MNLTTRQIEIYKKISRADPSWTQEGFVKCWNDILKLNKFISISKGKLILEFDDPNYATMKFSEDNKTLIEEKLYWNEYIQSEKSASKTREIALTIKNLAETIAVNS
jgi:hypothetical protein